MDTTHDTLDRMQMLLIEQLVASVDPCRRLHIADVLRADAERVADVLDDDQDAQLAGWLGRVLGLLEGAPRV